MKRAALVTGSLLAIAIVDQGCSKPRDGFNAAPIPFVEDAGGSPAADDCPLQCARDLRSVVRSCDGALVEACAPNLACGEGGCVDPCVAAAQAQGSVGCEFVMLPPPTTLHSSRNCYAAYVVNVQPAAADLRFEYRGQTMDLSGAVFTFASGTGDLTPHEGALQPGEGVVVFLSDPPNKAGVESEVFCPKGVKPLTTEWPISTALGIEPGASFRLVTNMPVTASTIYPFGGAKSFMPTSTLLLPVAGWGKQHVLIGAWQRAPTGSATAHNDYPGVQIVAAEDDTTIEVIKGPLKGSLKTYTLSRGQALQIMQVEDPSGSIITSNKPTTVFGGHSCLNVPTDVCCCEAAQQQLPAIEQWGREYAAVGHRPRVGNEFEPSPLRVVAAFDGTQLFYDPAPPAGAPRRMESGDIATFWANGPFVVRSQDSEHPIYVAQYMTGASTVGHAGDPEFVNVVPAGQYLGSYAFYADPTYRETSLVVVRQKQGAEFKDVRLECAGGNIPDFRPVGTEGQFEYAHVDLTRGGRPLAVLPDGSLCGHGLQQLRSDGPFSATLWGWDDWASYAYAGGMGQRKLVKSSVVVH